MGFQWQLYKELKKLNKNLKSIIMTQAEATVTLNTVSAQVTQIQADVQTLINSGQNLTPELETAVNNLVGVVQALDDLVPGQ
jgi:conjugal transfer/entry exclusion protein